MDIIQIIVGSFCFFILAAWIFFLPDETICEKTGLSAKVILPGIFCLVVGDWVSLPLDIANSQVHVKLGSIIIPILLGCFFLFALRESHLRWQSFLLLGADFILLLLGDSFFAAQITWPSTYLFWGLQLVSVMVVAFILQDYGAFLGVNLIALPCVFMVQGLWRAKLVSIVHVGGAAVYSMLAVSCLIGVFIVYLQQQRERRHFMERVLSADK